MAVQYSQTYDVAVLTDTDTDTDTISIADTFLEMERVSVSTDTFYSKYAYRYRYSSVRCGEVTAAEFPKMMLSGVAVYSCRENRTGAAHDRSSTYVIWHAGVVFSVQ